MKKTKLLKTLLIPTLGISTIGFVTTVATSCGEQPKPSTFSVTGGSLSLSGVINKSGSDEKTWVLKKDGEIITDGVTWDIMDPVSGVLIINGIVSWADTIQSGTHKFNVAARYNDQFYISEDITLSIENYEVSGSSKKIEVIPDDSGYDKGNRWSLIKTKSGKVITEGVTWKLVAAEGSSVPEWIKLNENNEISWENAVKGIYAFYIQATYDEEIFTSSDPFVLKVDYASYDSLEITPDKDGAFEVVNYGDNNPKLLYSFDENNWSEYSQRININKGQTLYLKGDNPNGWSHSAISYSQFRITGDISVTGNIMALLDNGAKDGDPGNITDIPNNYCFMKLFENCSELKGVEYYLLPATTLKDYCYNKMFEGCSSLVNAPALPATKLAEACYSGMFINCSNLTSVPILSALILATSCYNEMFSQCTKLSKAPELPAKILADKCYSGMFEDCASLATAPELTATDLWDTCYYQMFKGCTSLTKAPELPATALAYRCYEAMFQGCTSIQESPHIGGHFMDKDCCKYMFAGCTSLQHTPTLNQPHELKEGCYFGMFEGCTSLTLAAASGYQIATSCFENMFYGCSKLKLVVIDYSGEYDQRYFNNWVSGVADVGTFRYNGNYKAQDFGFPENWITIPF